MLTDIPDLITASMYWSMLEVGLGYIATNSIVVYGLVAHMSVKSSLRSIRSLLSLHKLDRISSRETNDTLRADEGQNWPTYTGELSTSAQYVGQDIEAMHFAGDRIHMKQEIESTMEYIERP